MNVQAEKKESQHRKGLDTRVVRLETEFNHLATKADIAELRGDLKNDIADFRNELRTEIKNETHLLFGALIAAVLALSVLMAKGFHWI